MLKKRSHEIDCRLCRLQYQALQNPDIDRTYAFLKNELSFLGLIGFEAELYRLIERRMK